MRRLILKVLLAVVNEVLQHLIDKYRWQRKCRGLTPLTLPQYTPEALSGQANVSDIWENS